MDELIAPLPWLLKEYRQVMCQPRYSEQLSPLFSEVQGQTCPRQFHVFICKGERRVDVRAWAVAICLAFRSFRKLVPVWILHVGDNFRREFSGVFGDNVA